MAQMIEQRRITFGATIDQIVRVAEMVAGQFGRDMKYVSHNPLHTLVTTVQQFPGQDHVALSLRPAGDGRSAVTISASVENMATDFNNEMARHLPE